MEGIRLSLATVGGTLTTFETEDFIYNRWPHLPSSSPAIYRVPAVAGAESTLGPDQALSRLFDANLDPDWLAVVLADERPRIRTLAMALLFIKEDPKLLGYIARHFNDTAQTFPALLKDTANFDPTRTATQTIGSIAKAMVGAYLLAAGIKEWRDPQYDDWNNYDMTHRSRPYCLSWLIVRLSRITGLQAPFPEERRPMLSKFRKELDSLPTDDRDLYLLWLCHGNRDFDGGGVLATEEELVGAAKRLGRQKLLQIVDGRPPGTDPDVAATQEWQSRTRYQLVVSFILAHANKLFSRADEPFLAAIEQGQRDKIARGSSPAPELVSIEALSRARAMLQGDAR